MSTLNQFPLADAMPSHTLDGLGTMTRNGHKAVILLDTEGGERCYLLNDDSEFLMQFAASLVDLLPLYFRYAVADMEERT